MKPLPRDVHPGSHADRGFLVVLLTLCVWLSAMLLAGPVAAQDTAAEARAIAHVALRMGQPEATLVFYRDFLGFRERFRTNKVPGAANVYYRKGQTPEDIEKEKQGSLLLVDLRVGPDQSLELFATRGPDEPCLHHVAINVPEVNEARENLRALGVAVPPAPPADGRPLASFFAPEPNGQTIEVCPPGEQKKAAAGMADELGGRIVEVVFPLREAGASRRFYAEGLGLAAEEGDGFLRFTTDAGDRLLAGPASEAEPCLVIEVDDLEQTKAWLEARPTRAAHAGSLEITAGPEARRTIELRDPEGMRVALVERPAGLKP